MRYRPHPKEKEYFLANNGRVAYSVEVSEHTNSFWAMCEQQYGHNRLAYEDRISKNMVKAYKYPEYKKGMAERANISEKIKGVLLDHAQATQEKNTEKESR